MQPFKSLRKTRFVRSKIVRRVIKATLFVLLFVFFTTILDMSFEYDERATEEMLSAFSMQSDLDTVFVGNSAGEMMDATLYSTLSGAQAFNMCTPSQTLSVSYKNIRLAASQHPIRQVIILTTLDVVNSDNLEQIDHVYDRVVDSSSPVSTRIRNAVKRNVNKSFARETINREQSINIWIPWENERIHDLQSFKNNLSYRFSRLIRKEQLGEHIVYDLNVPKYALRPGTFNETDERILTEELDALPSLDVPSEMISADKLAELAEILSFCRNNGIECMMIITPHKTDYFERYESFRENCMAVSDYLGHFVGNLEFAYVDTEEDAAVHEVLPDAFFYDWEHISGEYRKQATEYLAGVIKGME